jgi:hypothetical protein
VEKPSKSLPRAPTGDVAPALTLDEEMAFLRGMVSAGIFFGVEGIGVEGGLMMPAEEALEEEKRLARCLRSF